MSRRANVEMKRDPSKDRPRGLQSKTKDLREWAEDVGYEPLFALMEIAEDERNSVQVRTQAHLGASQYLYPKPSSPGTYARGMEIDLENGLADCGKQVILAASLGMVTVEQAEKLMRMLESESRLVVVDDIVKRVEALEADGRR